MSLSPGTRIGKYTVRRKLAEGGMAEIFLCSAQGPEGFSKDVVIKRIRPFLADDPAFVQMFVAEARLASRLEHPNIVQIFDFDRHEDTYYLAMEWVRGASLIEVRKRCRELGRPFPPLLAAHLGAQVARGLAYAHRLTVRGEPLNVVHRDVTPHNVLLSVEGAVKLGDFGIAHAGQASTAPGLKGKFAYMSPEQARGEPVDGRCDVFALGVVLWELLTGGRPFEAESDMAVLRAVQQRVITPPRRLNPEVPEALDAAVMRALERSIDARWASAAEFQHALEEVVLRCRTDLSETDVGTFLREVLGPREEEPSVVIPHSVELSLASLALHDVGQVAEGPPTMGGGTREEGSATDAGDGADREVALGPRASLALARRRAGEETPEDILAPTWLLARDGAEPPVLVRSTASKPVPPARSRWAWQFMAIALICGASVGLVLRSAANARAASEAQAQAPAPREETPGPHQRPLPAALRAHDDRTAPAQGEPDPLAPEWKERSFVPFDASSEADQPATAGAGNGVEILPSPASREAGDNARAERRGTSPSERSQTSKKPGLHVGLVVLDVFPVAELRLNGKPRGEVRGRHSLRLRPGVHTLHFTHPNRSATIEVEVKAGATQQVRFNAFRPST